MRKWEEREKRQSAYIFRRININCVINKNERGQGRKDKEKKGREKVDFFEIGIGEKTSGTKYREVCIHI